MYEKVRINPNYQRPRWVAHIDLLGASALVESVSWVRIFNAYSSAINSFRQKAFDKNLIERITFSDSFILYTIGDDALSYRAIDSFCRLFIVRLITSSIPVRGAMAFGDFYADPTDFPHPFSQVITNYLTRIK